MSKRKETTMADLTVDKRIDIDKFDEQSIKELSSELVKTLTKVAKEDPEAHGKLHIKLGHIRLGFSRSGHFEVIVGNPEPGDSGEPGKG
jgi:hypothetical protein